MFLLDALIRCIQCCGQDEQERDFYSYRNNRDYTSLNPPIPRSTSSPQNHLYRDESRPLRSPSCCIDDSRGLPDVTSIHGDGDRTIFPNFSSPSLSSSVSDSSTAASLSSKTSFAPVSSTRSNISAIGLSTGPEKFQIKKNSATSLPETPYTASRLSKFHSSPISSSTASAPLSQNPSFDPVSSAKNNASVSGRLIDPKKLQNMNDSATASQLAKVPSPSISSSAAPPPSSKKPPLASVPSTINKISAVGIQISPERPGVSSPLSKCDYAYTSSSTKNSIYPMQQSNSYSSKKPSLASISSTNNSISEIPVRVWQIKLPISPDSNPKLAEKPSSSFPSLPSLRNNAISPPPTMPPVHIPTANNSFSWQKKGQTSMDPSRKSVQNIPALSPFLIKVVSPECSSSSKASSPLSSLESGISNLRKVPKYEIPKCMEEMIRNDIVPPVLMCPLSPLTYSNFFTTLLYAEDFYIEKWSKYLLEGITLELRSRIASTHSQQMMRKRKVVTLVQRDFVAFKIDSVPEERPYLLSRDFVFLQPLNEIAGPFKGRLYRVVKGTILVEFGEDFHSQHSPSKRYDVNFSFNRVCLKRAHHAISVATDPAFHNILFPDQIFSSHLNNFHLLMNGIQFDDHVRRILDHKGPFPYLLNGQLATERPADQILPADQIRPADLTLSFTGLIIKATLLNIRRTNPRCRILVCSATNIVSDVLLRSLMKEIPVPSLFRANAAYRNYNLVPDDIIPASHYEEEEECFECPPLAELLNFNIITCTFMSSFRLYAAGIDSEHFTHIFLVDACLATEPEAIIPLAHLAGRNTVVVVTGCSVNSPSWVRSDIARTHGLKVSYFHRLLQSVPQRSTGSMFSAHLA